MDFEGSWSTKFKWVIVYLSPYDGAEHRSLRTSKSTAISYMRIFPDAIKIVKVAGFFQRTITRAQAGIKEK